MEKHRHCKLCGDVIEFPKYSERKDLSCSYASPTKIERIYDKLYAAKICVNCFLKDNFKI